MIRSPWDQLDVELARFGPYVMFSLKKPYSNAITFPEYVRLIYPFETLDGTEVREAKNLKLTRTALPDIFYKLEENLRYRIDQIEESRRALSESTLSSPTREGDTMLEYTYENNKHIYQQELLSYQQLQQTYPHTSANDAILHITYPPIPPDFETLENYFIGLKQYDELGFNKWCVTGKIIRSLGNFQISTILGLKSGTIISHMEYYIITLRTNAGTIDIGIMGIEENTDEGIEQRLRICLSAWNTTLLNAQLLLSLEAKYKVEVPKSEVKRRFMLWQDRFLLFQENYNALFRT